jgi:hypothetical protein
MCATCGNQLAEIAVLLEEQYIFVISSLDATIVKKVCKTIQTPIQKHSKMFKVAIYATYKRHVLYNRNFQNNPKKILVDHTVNIHIC